MRSAFCMTVMAIAALPLMAALPLQDQDAHAAEAATGVYLQDDTYFYCGKIGDGTTLAPAASAISS
jgi:hypothetical protein